MANIDLKFGCYYLNIDPKFDIHRQKMRALNLKMYEALKE